MVVNNTPGFKHQNELLEDSKTLLHKNENKKNFHAQENRALSIPLPLPEDSLSTSSDGSSLDVREKWGKQMDFFLSCVGYAVGLGNIWRFPYLCYQNGGGAFLIPYIIFLILCGMPLFYLELSFGQFASLGPVEIWKICPLFRGLGFGMVIISAIVCIYYNIIIAWTLYYIYNSLTTVVPWASCGNPWNTDACVDQHITRNSSLTHYMTSSEEFWLFKVLHLSPGIEYPGNVVWPLVFTLFLAWVVVYFCLWKGVKSSGKIVYVSATFPYVILLITFVYGLTLPGAFNGILFYLSPDWKKLASFKVWADAATQIFYSVGAAWGALLTMASYNKFRNNCYRDAIIVPVINCLTSFFAGLVVFSIIGYMAFITDQDIKDVVSEGPGLAFVVYPEAVSRLPFPPLWAILFFMMLFTIGLDSQFGMLETVISVFVDQFPYLRKRKEIFTAFVCLVLFLLGLPCVTEGGMYVLQLMDWYSATFALMAISLCECIVIAWIYGVKRYMNDIKLMIDVVPSLWWRICWQFITPLSILCLLGFVISTHSAVKYNDYTFPSWSLSLGWFMSILPLIPIPVCAILQIYSCKGSLKERLIESLRPDPEWGPALEEDRLNYKQSIATVPSNIPQAYVANLRKSNITDSNDFINTIPSMRKLSEAESIV